MIDIIVRSFIGDLGGNILDFYLEYSLIINGIILLYFLCVVLGRRNYSFILNSVLKFLENDHQRLFTKKNPDNVAKILKSINIPWMEILDNSKFPVLTPPGRYWFYLKNTRNIKKLFSEEALANIIVKAS